MADKNEIAILDYETGSFWVYNSGVFKISADILNDMSQFELKLELRNQESETLYSGPIKLEPIEDISAEFTVYTSQTTDEDNSPVLCLVNKSTNETVLSWDCYGEVVPAEIKIISPY